MATREAPIKDGIKRALIAADENQTTLVMTTVKNHERVYKNKVAEEVRAIEAVKPGDFGAIHHLVRGGKLSRIVSGNRRRRIERLERRMRHGSHRRRPIVRRTPHAHHRRGCGRDDDATTSHDCRRRRALSRVSP